MSSRYVKTEQKVPKVSDKQTLNEAKKWKIVIIEIVREMQKQKNEAALKFFLPKSVFAWPTH